MPLLNVILATSLALTVSQQPQAPATYSEGDVMELSGVRLTVKVGTAERFANVKVAGTPVVVQMQFTSKEWILLWFRPGPKPSNSDLTLLVGDQVFAPVAMTDDHPSPSGAREPVLTNAGAREPVLMNELLLAPATGKSFIGWNFEGAQGVWWLFDVPLGLERAPRTASLKFDLGNQPRTLLIKLR